MGRAIERHNAGSATVIPVILQACDWRDAPFGGLLAAPKDGKPIMQWADIDSAFLDVTAMIKAVLRKRAVQLPCGKKSPTGPRRRAAGVHRAYRHSFQRPTRRQEFHRS
jgi:hypothetical protein